MQRFLLRPCLSVALVAAFTFAVAQVGALAHAWAHVVAHPVHGDLGHVAGHGDTDPHAGHEESVHVALCELCAHFAAVLHGPATPAASTFAAPTGRVAASPGPVVQRPPIDAFHYPARAPPVVLI